MEDFIMQKNIKTMMVSMVLVLSLVLTGCGQNSSDTNTASDNAGELATIRLGVMTSNISHQYAILGQERGIYEKHGLNVELTEYAAGINTVDALVTGQLDIGFVADFAGINRIGNTSGESNLRFFAQLASSKLMQFYVNPDKIKELSDLKGKNIITLLGTVWEYWDAKTLEMAGLTADDVEYKAVESAQDGLAVANSGEGDAFWASGENVTRLEKYGWKPILTQEDFDVATYQIYMSNEEYLSKNQETVQKFLEATQEIIDYLNNNLDEAADIIYKKTGMSQEVFKNSVEAYNLGLDFDQKLYDGLKEISTWTYEAGYYANQFELKNFIDTDALKAAYPDKVSWSAE